MPEEKEAFVKDEEGDTSNTDRNGRLGKALQTIHARKNIVKIFREEGQWRIVYQTSSDS